MGTSTHITGVHTVAVPVVDMDAALAFYTGTLGLELRFDAVIGPGMRWIEVVPPGGGTSLALVRSGDELPTGVDTGIRLVTADAEADHAHLAAAGVAVDEVLRWEGVPTMFHFRDPDGNSLYVMEQDAEG